MLNLFFRKQFVLSRELLVEALKVMFFPLILDNKGTMFRWEQLLLSFQSLNCAPFFFLGGRSKKDPDHYMVLTTQGSYSKGSIFCI